jgi:hypothetical protein
MQIRMINVLMFVFFPQCLLAFGILQSIKAPSVDHP